MLEYFDAHLVGLTATPDARTYGFFEKNVVSEYDHERAVADGVNVGNEIYVIETERSKRGGLIKAGQDVERRERLSRAKRWETQDEEEAYGATEENPRSVLAQFRNEYNPRIAVTVDMIATGTDVRPLECLLFMRDVKSRSYFEQMKGRGTRTLDGDGLRKVTPSAAGAKTHYVIVDAVGVTASLKTPSQPLVTKPSVPLLDLATSVMMGHRDDDTVSSLAGRLARLDRQLDDREKARIATAAGGRQLSTIVGDLLVALDPDRIEAEAKRDAGELPITDAHRTLARDRLVGAAAEVFTGPFIALIDGIRREKEQTVVHDHLDSVIRAEWAGDSEENARALTADFASWMETNRDEIEAITIFYRQPARRAEVTYAMISAVLDRLKADRPNLAPLRVWSAYALLDEARDRDPGSELTALVALIRRVCGLDAAIAPFPDTVRRNFQDWIMARHSGTGPKFTQEQVDWLRMIRDYVAASVHIDRDDLDMAPFDARGGLGRMYQLFGDGMDGVLDELNGVLAA